MRKLLCTIRTKMFTTGKIIVKCLMKKMLRWKMNQLTCNHFYWGQPVTDYVREITTSMNPEIFQVFKKSKILNECDSISLMEPAADEITLKKQQKNISEEMDAHKVMDLGMTMSPQELLKEQKRRELQEADEIIITSDPLPVKELAETSQKPKILEVFEQSNELAIISGQERNNENVDERQVKKLLKETRHRELLDADVITTLSQAEEQLAETSEKLKISKTSQKINESKIFRRFIRLTGLAKQKLWNVFRTPKIFDDVEAADTTSMRDWDLLDEYCKIGPSATFEQEKNTNDVEARQAQKLLKGKRRHKLEDSDLITSLSQSEGQLAKTSRNTSKLNCFLRFMRMMGWVRQKMLNVLQKVEKFDDVEAPTIGEEATFITHLDISTNSTVNNENQGPANYFARETVL